MKNLLRIIRKSAYFLSILIFGYILISQVVSFFSINIVNFDYNLGNIDYLKILLITAFLSAGAGMILDSAQGKIIHDNFFTQSFKDKVIITISAIFLSYFFVSSGDFRSIKNVALFGLIFIFLLYFLPKLIYFIVTPQEAKYDSKSIHFNKISAVISVLLFFGIFIFIITIVLTYLSSITKNNPAYKNQLYILSVDPRTATLTQKVTITGYNFGWKSNETYKLMSKEGEIPQTDWTNEKIEFTIPLFMKSGSEEIWITRPQSGQTRKIEESNRVPIRIVDRFTFYPVENEPKWKRAIKRIHRLIFFDIKIFNDYLYR